MKKVLAIFCCTVLLCACSVNETNKEEENQGNYIDEMKISYALDLSEEDGADSAEREGDHPKSPYFNQIDFYNLESTDTLTILPKFKTMQQTSEWSCGVVASLMVMNYFDRLDQFNEKSLAEMRYNELEPEATSLASISKR